MNDANDVNNVRGQSRRSVNQWLLAAAGAAVAGPIMPGQAQAAEFNMKLGADTPVTYALTIRAKEAAERIKKETSDRVGIQIFPNTQLGSDPEMLSQARSGAIQMHYVPCLLLQNVIPDCGVHGVAFAFKDYPAVWAAMDGELGALQRKAIFGIGLYPLGAAWDNGFRQITTTSKQIQGPADLAGMKLRVPPFPMNVSIFESLGASPTPVNIKETYAALQTGLVDGQENPLTVLELMKWGEIQKYCALTNHLWDGYWPCINLKYWERLPQDVQQIVEKSFGDAAKLQRADNEAVINGLQADLAKKGISFNKPDIGPFREALVKAGYYDKWRKSFSPEAWAFLERYAGKLG